ncbi:MAG: hypothetical protein RLZZ74_3807 [Cyanobacteriota bacterium]
MVWKITAEELIIRYGDGERNFAGIELLQSERFLPENPIDLKGVSLRNVNLRGACLRYADLTGAVLIEAFLQKATVRDANMESVNLHWSSLHEVDLRGTTLSHMNATGAFFCGARIGGFDYAILVDADFRNTNTFNSTLCRGGNVIWNTVMSDGTIIVGPQYGDGR